MNVLHHITVICITFIAMHNKCGVKGSQFLLWLLLLLLLPPPGGYVFTSVCLFVCHHEDITQNVLDRFACKYVEGLAITIKFWLKIL